MQQKKETVTAGIDYIGVGVGALVFNEKGKVFLAQRGPKAKNERGHWEFPGGTVDLWETMADTIGREMVEEFGMEIEITGLLGVADHMIKAEGQHWISATYLARHVGGIPTIAEPGKCSAIGWFTMDALPQPLSLISMTNVQQYEAGLM